MFNRILLPPSPSLARHRQLPLLSSPDRRRHFHPAFRLRFVGTVAQGPSRFSLSPEFFSNPFRLCSHTPTLLLSVIAEGVARRLPLGYQPLHPRHALRSHSPPLLVRQPPPLASPRLSHAGLTFRGSRRAIIAAVLVAIAIALRRSLPLYACPPLVSSFAHHRAGVGQSLTYRFRPAHTVKPRAAAISLLSK